MLVLARKEQEGITMTLTKDLAAGSTIKIVAVEVVGRNVKIGIDAPSSVRVNRDEIENRISETR